MATYNVYEKGILTEPEKESDESGFIVTEYIVNFLHNGTWEKVPYPEDKPVYLEEDQIAEGILSHVMQNGRVVQLRSHNPVLQQDIIDIPPSGYPTATRALSRRKLERLALKISAGLKVKS